MEVEVMEMVIGEEEWSSNVNDDGKITLRQGTPIAAMIGLYGMFLTVLAK